ncbi:MAG: aminotransferase class III-fold pyridoxal phosphate-dependent enzyme [Candidatus Zixiibacteriota bacterium]
MANSVTFNDDYPNISQSDAFHGRALGLIPNVTQTLAKGPSQYVNGVAPKYLARGKGARVWDVDGNEYLDYNMGIGPLSLGYAYPKVDAAIKQQLADGITFSLMHPLEVEVAELLREVLPNAESIRFSKSGADVTSAAVRLARAFTGKDKILCCGYHGWHDWYVSVTTRNRGVPQAVRDLTYTFNYNDIDSFRSSLDGNVAAVILEPVIFTEPKENFLHAVSEICQREGVVLIFDEMWTGFRLAIGGAQEYFGIKPDLATYSKAVANGMPISMLTGKREIMQLNEDDCFFFTTFGGEALSLAAAKATITEIRDQNVPAYLDEQGKKLKSGYNAIAEKLGLDFTRCTGYTCRSLVNFDASAGDPLLLKSLVQQEMIKRGILWSGFHNVSFSHTDADVGYTLKTYEEVLTILKQAVEENRVGEQLRGEPVRPVFRKTTDFNTKPVGRE